MQEKISARLLDQYSQDDARAIGALMLQLDESFSVCAHLVIVAFISMTIVGFISASKSK